MTKRPCEENQFLLSENEPENVPSTSTGVTEAKRSRLNYNFWKKTGSQSEHHEVREENIKINQFKIGKM